MIWLIGCLRGKTRKGKNLRSIHYTFPPKLDFIKSCHFKSFIINKLLDSGCLIITEKISETHRKL